MDSYARICGILGWKDIMENFIIRNSQAQGFQLYIAGQEACAPAHHFGPAVRKHYLLHYIFSGRGQFTVDGHTYRLRAGQAFLILPNVVTFYQADTHEPWHYAWLEFGGAQAEAFLQQCHLSREQPIYTAGDADGVQSQWLQLLEHARTDDADGYRVTGSAFLLLDAIIRQNAVSQPVREQAAEQYIQRAVAYIRYNYYRPIAVTELCALVGVERSYLCRLFQKQTGSSPQGYILAYKLDAARALLRERGLSVAQAARSVGYEDQSAFSKLYKKRFGISPKQDQSRFRG